MPIQQWSTTAADNDDAVTGINWQENQLPSTVNDSARAMMADVAAWRIATEGGLISAGSSNAYTIASTGLSLTSYAEPLMIAFKADRTSTGAATIALDGLTARDIMRADGTASQSGDIQEGGVYVLSYVAADDVFVGINMTPTLASGFRSDVSANNYKLTNLGTATATTDAVSYGQVQQGMSWAAEATISSATTTNVAGSARYKVNVSGTTTVTGLGTGNNRMRLITFTGPVPLTHNATSLILPKGGSDITAASGDNMLVWFDSSSNARGMFYQRADGKALVPPAVSEITNAASLAAEDQVLTGGATVTSKDLGTITSGTVTIDVGARPVQNYTNNGAHSLACGSSYGSTTVAIINGATPGTINTTDFSKVYGSFTYTTGQKFKAIVSNDPAGKLLQIIPMQ